MRKKFMEKLNRIVNDAVSHAAYEAAYIIENQYESIISKFYDDYTPHIYERTYSTYLASSMYSDYSKGIRKLSDGSYEVGIYVSPQNIPDDPYIDDKEYVFWRTFEEGIHGLSRKDVRANPKEHTIVSYMNIPKRMKPAPRVLMDKWWRKFKKNNEMKTIMDQAIAYSIRKNADRRFKRVR